MFLALHNLRHAIGCDESHYVRRYHTRVRADVRKQTRACDGDVVGEHVEAVGKCVFGDGQLGLPSCLVVIELGESFRCLA